MLNSDDRNELEALIDQHSLHDVIDALSIITNEKSDHVWSNWQDKELAKSWEAASHKLDKIAYEVIGI